MVGGEFASCRAKLGRAEEHLHILGDEIEKWSKSDPCLVLKESNAERGNYSFWVEIVKPPPLFRWSLIAGDFSHNIRSALDNMLWELAVSETGQDPPPKPKSIQFPITDDPDAFEKERYRISCLSADTQARIERAQPYHRLHVELPPLLGLVRDFNNLDKHRLLNVVVANVQQGHLSLTYEGLGNPTLTPEYDLGPIECRTKVASLSVTPPQPDMDCKYEGAVVISISHSPGPDGRTMGELFHILYLLLDEVREVVSDISW